MTDDITHNLTVVREALEAEGLSVHVGLIDAAIEDVAKLRERLAGARKALTPFALIADIDAKGKDGLESVYVMVAAGRLHDARRFLSLTDDNRDPGPARSMEFRHGEYGE